MKKTERFSILAPIKYIQKESEGTVLQVSPLVFYSVIPKYDSGANGFRGEIVL